MTPLVLTAHGSSDPRSETNAWALAGRVAGMRPGLDVRVAFLERAMPRLDRVLADIAGPAVVTPLLLAAGHHARVDIPRQIAAAVPREAACDVHLAQVLGEDERLVEVLRDRLRDIGVDHNQDGVGVVVVAAGTSNSQVNARTARVAPRLLAGTCWTGTTTAFATGQHRPPAEAIGRLRRQGARRIVVAPWFLAPGKICDRVHHLAATSGIAMAEPLGAHDLVAQIVLDRFDASLTARTAA